jgi:predicted MFS family arabinose efflux permease
MLSNLWFLRCDWDQLSAPMVGSNKTPNDILYLDIALSGSIGGLGIEWIGSGNLGFVASMLAALALLLISKKPKDKAGA